MVDVFKAQIPDNNQGLRAEWLKGSWGVNWKPENFYNGIIEGVSIETYLEDLDNLRTLDYVQVHLTESNIFSPSHSAPHQLLESFWQDDTNSNGDPINLIVPRQTADDPFLAWLKAIKAKGLKTMVYVNSYNLLARDEENIPNGFPDISNRWMNWCDTNPEAQAFINSKSYHNGNGRRKYMFCYAEFILKEYSKRYGDLIDAWAFDSADNIMEVECGDNPASEDVNDQRIYQAFAEACRSGNPNAAISFNNSVGTFTKPFTTATYFDDFTFGHPFGGAGNMVETQSLYDRNFGICEFLQNSNGNVFRTDDRTWNNNVVGRFFPKWSTTAWNAGSTPCLTDTQFVEWTSTAIIDAGSITWGTALIRNNLVNDPILTIQPLALEQYMLADNYLKENQYSDIPNWARQHTIFPPAYKNIQYSHKLKENVDFWDPQGNSITSLIASGSFPSWLTITEVETGIWEFSGIPIETTNTSYNFDLNISNNANSSSRKVELKVFENITSEPITIDVQIQAEENTTYNSGAIKMTGLGTIPNYNNTFEINITVTPNGDFTQYPNAVIVSGESDSSGNSTTRSWGISGDGTNESSNDRIFAGEEQFSATISNATLGAIYGSSNITAENITIDTFKSITIVNAHSVGDRFTFSADNSADFELGRFNNEVKKVVDLTSESSNTQIESFTIKNGSTSSNDKWAVENIIVQVSFTNLPSTLDVSSNLNQIELFKLYPNPANNQISFNINSVKTEIFNITGKLVKSVSQTKNTIDISTLNSGIYIVKVQSEEGNIFFKKLLKE